MSPESSSGPLDELHEAVGAAAAAVADGPAAATEPVLDGPPG